MNQEQILNEKPFFYWLVTFLMAVIFVLSIKEIATTLLPVIITPRELVIRNIFGTEILPIHKITKIEQRHILRKSHSYEKLTIYTDKQEKRITVDSSRMNNYTDFTEMLSHLTKLKIDK